MNNEKDELKECIAREFEEIAKEEEESLEKDTSLVVPEGTKEAVLARLKEQMREYQREQAEMKPEKEKKPSIIFPKKTAEHWNSEERC